MSATAAVYEVLEQRALCRACGGFCGARGDHLCGDCWKFVPVEAKRHYMKIWRGVQAGRSEPADLDRAMQGLVLIAKRRGVVELVPASFAQCSRCHGPVKYRGRFRVAKPRYCLDCETTGERKIREDKKAWWRAHKAEVQARKTSARQARAIA